MPGPGGGLIAVFLTFHIGGGIIGLPVVIACILASKQVSRHPTLLNFCATWTLSSIVYTLLLFAGQQNNPHPPEALCVAQAAMVNGVFPMTSVAGVALVAHIWHGLAPMHQRPWSQWSQFTLAPQSVKSARLFIMLIAPYVVFLAFTIGAAVAAKSDESLVTASDQFFYCNMHSGAFTVLVPAFTSIAMGVILLLELAICWKIFRSAVVRQNIARTSSSFFLLRLAGFTIYSCIALIVSALFLSKSNNYSPYILQSTLPFAVFLFIGTQKEVLRIWYRCFRPCCGNSRDSIDSESDEIENRQTRSTIGLMKELGLKTPTTTPKSPAVQLPPAEPIRLVDVPLDVASDDYSTDKMYKASSPPILHSRLPVTAYDLTYGISHHNAIIDPTPRPPPPMPKDITNSMTGFRSEVERNLEKTIATQKQTIARLTEENGFLKKSHDRLQDTEKKALAKTQNLLVTEKRTAQQLRSYTNQMETDLQNQTKILNDLLVKHKELEDKSKRQSTDIKRLTKENRSLSEALKESVRNEMHWKDDHGKVKMENTKLVSEVKNLKSERDILLDIWSTLESPVDWEMQKGRGGAEGKRADYRKSPQFIYPHLAKEMRQRASQPNIQARALSRIQAKQIRRMTEKPGAGVVDNLDRLRPKLLAIGGKMELSEKVTSLEELVREQTALIEELEAIIVEEQQDHLRYEPTEGGTGNFPIPSSIGSSMIAEKDSVRTRP